MIVADTSAIMAVLTNEREGPGFLDTMVNDGEVLISTASAVELMIVAMGRGDEVYRSAIRFFDSPFVRLIPLDEEQLWAAVDAYARYGKGQTHRHGNRQ